MSSVDSSGRLADQLADLTRRLHRAQRRRLEPLGVTPAQARLLRTLERCDSPPRMADLAALMDVVPRAITSLVDALEEHGAVRRAPDAASRRVTRVEITEEGAGLLRELREARRSAVRELLAPLSGAEQEELSTLLSALEPETNAQPSSGC
ncbi:MarR family transcriptional regulator [Streptomyces sp. XM4193]|uniref:MarR family winged helix-turn-helix transcriptional regulator n=1 Tax=Streptomyces sp. XM4193 TaxID=2929782 RepID=UPI001FF7E994|nr:MarR family transcriptional regulator [Streptomyces sp. XM4193]MCK1798109.1 MarR family transcriptional regulator [Streptomyces sp. XM4193]